MIVGHIGADSPDGSAKDVGAGHIFIGDSFRPSIDMAGYSIEPLDADYISLKIMAAASSIKGISRIQDVSLFYEGMPLGIGLHDDGMDGDDFADDGVFTHVEILRKSDLPQKPVLLEIAAHDDDGEGSSVWPYLTISQGGGSFGETARSKRRPATLLAQSCSSSINDPGPGDDGPPRIVFWGDGDSSLLPTRGGVAIIDCIVYDPKGIDDVESVELWYEDRPTGTFLQFDADTPELYPYYGMFSLTVHIEGPLPAGTYLLEAKATSKSGATSDSAPYVYFTTTGGGL